MLQSLAELMNHKEKLQLANGRQLNWVEFSDEDIQDAFPFWAVVDIKRVQLSLQNLGLLAVEPDPTGGRSQFMAIDEASASSQPVSSHSISPTIPPMSKSTHSLSRPIPAPDIATQAPVAARAQSAGKLGSASLMPPNWQPDDSWIKQCVQHNIPEQFAHALVPEFVNYWRDRGQARFSWGNAFYKHVLKEWRSEQTRQGAYELASVMSAEWKPSPDAVGILEMADINLSFIEDAIPEFVLYWRERGIVNGAWNTKFLEHIRRQWAKFSAAFGYDSTPRVIPHDWQPSGDCYDILGLAEIDENYARGKIPEFVMYWRDSQQVKSSWNTVFLQFIKQDWARQLKEQEGADITHAENQTLVGKSQQKIKERFQRIADRSWAE